MVYLGEIFHVWYQLFNLEHRWALGLVVKVEVLRSVGLRLDSRWLWIDFLIYLDRLSDLFVISLSEISKSQVHAYNLVNIADNLIESHCNIHKYCNYTLNKLFNVGGS